MLCPIIVAARRCKPGLGRVLHKTNGEVNEVHIMANAVHQPLFVVSGYRALKSDDGMLGKQDNRR